MNLGILKRFYHWLVRETLNIIPAVIYFLIVFNLLYYTVGLSIGAEEHRHISLFMVNMGSLILGKVLLISNALPFINAFPHKPLIYNILWKIMIYIFMTYVIWALEVIREMHKKFYSFQDAFAHVWHHMTTPLFWSCILWLAYAFFIFIVFNEFVRELGREKVVKMLFGGK